MLILQNTTASNIIKYGGILNADDLQLNTSNYNNTNSFVSSAKKYQHTIKTSREAGGNMCPSL
jgi:C4-dicarboxylate-specific signal transduction histidine kinase